MHLYMINVGFSLINIIYNKAKYAWVLTCAGTVITHRGCRPIPEPAKHVANGNIGPAAVAAAPAITPTDTVDSWTRCVLVCNSVRRRVYTFVCVQVIVYLPARVCRFKTHPDGGYSTPGESSAVITDRMRF